MSRHLDLGCSLQCGAISSCGDCQELGDIDEEVERGEVIVQQAKTRRSALLEKVNSRRDVLMSKLPIEIVCYVFEEYVKLYEVKSRHHSLSMDLGRPRYFALIHRRGPLSLGTICRKWRNIAWAHSQLWRTLVISISCPGHDMGPTMVSEWLKKTGEQQLNIQMHQSPHNQDILAPESADLPQMKKNARLVVQALNHVSPRWRGLDFSECPVDVLSELDDTGCASQSVLEDLCVGYNATQRGAMGLSLFEKSMHKHRPRHLNLLCAIRPSRFNIGWTRLTHLYLEDMSLKNCFRILTCTAKSSPALRHLTLRLMDDFFHLDFGEDTYNFRHPALETLVIREEECDPETTARLFSALTLPALRTLKYDGDDMDNEFPVEDFVAFLTRSTCSIETLELLTLCVEDDDLADMLRAAPSVRLLKLELTNENDAEELFKCLSQKNLADHSAAPFLPNLTRLDITAKPPRNWRDFVGMFADDPMIHTPDFGQTRPIRHALQVTFTIHSDGVRGATMDLMSLSQLAVLWKMHKFFAVFKIVDELSPSMNGANFLLESYRLGSEGLPRPALEKYTKLEKYLAAISSLSF